MTPRVSLLTRRAAITGVLLTAAWGSRWTAVAAAQAGEARAPASAEATAPAASAGGSLDEVREILNRYQQAYTERDAAQAKAIWPAVNEGALKRAFDQLASQELTFADCQIDLNEAESRASASCRGSVRFVPRVGEGVSRVQMRTWDFVIARLAGTWHIESVESVEAVPPAMTYPESPVNTPIRSPR